MIHNRTARPGGILIVVLALMCVIPVGAQPLPVPDVTTLNTLYDGELTGPVVHTMQLARPGRYALYVRSDAPAEVVLTLPDRQTRTHRFSRERNHFLFFNATRQGELRIEVSLVDEDRYAEEPFYGFVVSESVEIGTDGPLEGSLVAAGVMGSEDHELGIRIYSFTAFADAQLTVNAEVRDDSLTMIMGGSDGFASEPSRSAVELPIGWARGEMAVQPGKEYGILLIGDLPPNDRTGGVRLTFSFGETVEVAARELEFDVAEVGYLSVDGMLIGGRRTQPYVYEGTRGETIAILLQSDEFDAYLYVETPDEDVLSDDDGASGTDSLITTTLRANGSYMIYASSFGGQEAGAFDIVVTDPDTAEATIASRAEASEDEWWVDEERPDDFEARVTAIASGDVIEGRLTLDSSIYRGDYVEIFELDVRDGTSIVLSLRSDEIDAYLTVVSPDGSEYTDDDGGGGTDSLLRMAALPAGTYRVHASAFGGGSFGEFTLSVDEYVSGPSAETVRAIPMEAGVEFAGRIVADSPVYEGDLAEVFEFTPRAGSSITVTLRSDDFDTYLYVRTPEGRVIPDDDGGGGAGGTDSRVEIDRGAAGTYRVYASSYGGQETGEFTIEVEYGKP